MGDLAAVGPPTLPSWRRWRPRSHDLNGLPYIHTDRLANHMKTTLVIDDTDRDALYALLGRD